MIKSLLQKNFTSTAILLDGELQDGPCNADVKNKMEGGIQLQALKRSSIQASPS